MKRIAQVDGRQAQGSRVQFTQERFEELLIKAVPLLLALVALLTIAVESDAQTSGQKTMANSLPVVIASDQTGLAGPPDVSVAVSLTAAQTTETGGTQGTTFQQVALAGMTSCSVQITSIAAGGQFLVDVSPDGGGTSGTWYNVGVLNPSGWQFTPPGTALTATGVWMITGLAGMSHARLRCTAITSGTATGTLRATVAQPGMAPAPAGARGADGNIHIITSDNSGNLLLSPIVDGNIATLGNTMDGPVGDAWGTVNAHLRRIAATAGPVAAGAAAGNSTLIGGVYNNPLPGLSSTQQAAVQLDAAGILLGDLWRVGGSSITLGQTTMSASLPVTLASNQSNVNVAVNAALPTGSNVIGSLSSHQSSNVDQVGGSALALGQTTMSASLPVTLASNQSNVNVAVNAALPAGSNVIGALSSHQSTNVDQVGGSALALGQTTMSASVPVAISSDQAAIPVTGATTGGATPLWVLNLTATVTSIKGTGGNLTFLQINNTSGATAYIQIFDSASGAGVTLGTTTPLLQFVVGNGATSTLTFGFPGITFSHGISIYSTTASKGSGTSASGVTMNAAAV